MLFSDVEHSVVGLNRNVGKLSAGHRCTVYRPYDRCSSLMKCDTTVQSWAYRLVLRRNGRSPQVVHDTHTTLYDVGPQAYDLTGTKQIYIQALPRSAVCNEISVRIHKRDWVCCNDRMRAPGYEQAHGLAVPAERTQTSSYDIGVCHGHARALLFIYGRPLSLQQECDTVFTARCTILQSAVLRSHVVCPSVCDVGGS